MTKQPKKGIAIPRHPEPPVEAALVVARLAGWLADYPKGHWGVIYCSYRQTDFDGHRQCKISVSSTPRVAEHHAREIRRKVTKCPGQTNNDPQEPVIEGKR